MKRFIKLLAILLSGGRLYTQDQYDKQTIAGFDEGYNYHRFLGDDERFGDEEDIYPEEQLNDNLDVPLTDKEVEVLQLDYQPTEQDEIEMKNAEIAPEPFSSIHLHSRRGIYQVVSLDLKEGTMMITCNKWNTEHLRGDRMSNYKIVPITDFKCYRGLPFSKK